jgi:predicted component of type VI protein secretion system
VELKCEICGQIFGPPAFEADRSKWKCPACGTPVESDESAKPKPEPKAATLGRSPAPIVSPPQASPADTVFQPHLMAETVIQDAVALGGSAAGEQEQPPGTQLLQVDPSELQSPPLQLEVDAFFLILGAPAGEERLPIPRAKTVFGRGDVDVKLADPTISGSHFQVEAFGKEFFVRDAGSRNGTYLNGTKIQYSQILPGDQVTIGKTTLIFRTSDDEIDRK